MHINHKQKQSPALSAIGNHINDIIRFATNRNWNRN